MKTGGPICCGAAHFPRNGPRNFTEYLGERLEMNSRGEKIKEGHCEKRKLERKIIMKTKLLKSIARCFLFACALAILIAAVEMGTPRTAQAGKAGEFVAWAC